MEITYVMKNEVGSFRLGLQKAIPRTDEDISTLLEVLTRYISDGGDTKKICDILVIKDNYYVLCVDTVDSSFDLYTYLNKNYSGNTKILCSNIKYLFPRSKSRGIYNDDYDERTGDMDAEDVDDSEEATGYMDDEDTQSVITLYLKRRSNGQEIPVSSNHVIIGRSKQLADFVVSGNTNISRKHCEVYVDNGNLAIKNLDPPNGTYINNRRMSAYTTGVLTKGSVLRLADEEFILEE